MNLIFKKEKVDFLIEYILILKKLLIIKLHLFLDLIFIWIIFNFIKKKTDNKKTEDMTNDWYISFILKFFHCYWHIKHIDSGYILCTLIRVILYFRYIYKLVSHF